MNWNQIYASANPKERFDLAIVVLRKLETGSKKWVFAGTWFTRERRRLLAAAHYVNDRRRRISWPRVVALAAFVFILLTVTAATWLFILHAPAQLGAPVLAFHLFSLIAILLIKPYRLRFTTSL